MKLQLITALALATLATLAVAPASAGPLKDAWVRQQTSIVNGVGNGLSVGEAARLEQKEFSILHQAAVLKANDGKIGPLERDYLGARLAGARASIFFHKHN